MRKQIVAGNWKMNLNAAESQELIHALKAQTFNDGVHVAIATPYVYLAAAVDQTAGTSIDVAAQNMHQAVSGAYTGEVSAAMLEGIGVKTVILGHSERRAYFHETDALLAEKVNAALENDMHVIFCFGEEIEDRKSGVHFDLVTSQLTNGLFHLNASQWASITLAYEPVWAIGTGETASPAQAQEMHAHIRAILAANYGDALAQSVSVLYGGSVKPSNAQEIFAQTDVDGALIGGASLKAEDFAAIVNAF
ncbi:MAG: triose-phosphate isomerase [Flavobacteriaceae bacterium]|nr:triose-phosphate isomerase [Flavobacteriaceae bacterium]|tara:strand:- start:484 stop:1233 length:750 start_codon:yes stop_codon:yes gene_type:complete